MPTATEAPGAPQSVANAEGNEGKKPAVDTQKAAQEKSFLAKKAEQARNLAVKLRDSLKRNPQNAQSEFINLARGTDDEATNNQRENHVINILRNGLPDPDAPRAAAVATTDAEISATADTSQAAAEAGQLPGGPPPGSESAGVYARWLQEQPGEYAADGVTINPLTADSSSTPDSDLVARHKAEIDAIKQPGRLNRFLPGGRARQAAYDQQRRDEQDRYNDEYKARRATQQAAPEANSPQPEGPAIADSGDSQTVTEHTDQAQLDINQLPSNLRQQELRKRLTQSSSQKNDTADSEQPTGQTSPGASSEQSVTEPSEPKASETDPVVERLTQLTDTELRLEAQFGNPTAIRILADRDAGNIGPAPIDTADLDRQRAFEDIMAIKEGGIKIKSQTAESPDASATDSAAKTIDAAEVSAEEDAVMLGKSDQDLLDLAFQDYNAEAQRVLLGKMEDLSETNSLEDLQKKAADGDLIAKTALEYIDHLKTLPVDTLKKRAFASSRAAKEALNNHPLADESTKQTVEASTEVTSEEVTQLVKKLEEVGGDPSQLPGAESQILKKVIEIQLAAQEAANQAKPATENVTTPADGTTPTETTPSSPEASTPADAASAKQSIEAMGVDPTDESGAKLFDLIDSSTPDALMGLWDQVTNAQGASKLVTEYLSKHGFKGALNPKNLYKFTLDQIVAEQQKIKGEESESEATVNSESEATEESDENTEEKRRLRSKIMEMLVTLAMALGAVAVEAMRGSADAMEESVKK